jgi:hypothetical protein
VISIDSHNQGVRNDALYTHITKICQLLTTEQSISILSAVFRIRTFQFFNIYGSHFDSSLAFWLDSRYVTRRGIVLWLLLLTPIQIATRIIYLFDW